MIGSASEPRTPPPRKATVARILSASAERLAAAGCETPRADAELLLAHVLGTSRSRLATERSRALAETEQELLESLLARREAREPLAYVLGDWGFRRLTLAVDRRVLVPRPETEIVVERCLAFLADRTSPRVLDVGTGSGAIALAIADECPSARVTGMDVSEAALAVARKNASRLAIDVELVRGDLFAGLPAGPWDLVVSNPPYVEPEEIELLEPEVREWEPREALVAAEATAAVARRAAGVLVRDGALVLEVAATAAGRVAGLLASLGYADVRTTRDLAGRERVVEGRRA